MSSSTFLRLYCAALVSVAVLSGQASASNGHEVTVCPSNGPGCVTLQQLLSGTQNFNKSDSTFKFEPSSFEMLSEGVITFVNVSNITFGAVGPHKANITCAGKGFVFSFQNVSKLVIHNLHFHSCNGYYAPINCMPHSPH